MSEYLVRWKFGPNSLLNETDVDTWWYQQFHPDKEAGVKHYTTLLLYSVPVMKVTVEIFELVQLVPGEEEPKDIVDHIVESPAPDIKERNQRILEMSKEGYTQKEIASAVGLHYTTVYTIIKKMSK